MKANRGVYVILLFFVAVISFGQSADTIPTHRVEYYNQWLVGGAFAKGADVATLTASTYHGLRYKQLAAGLGMSYDAYVDWKSVPLLISVAYDFAAIRKNYLFVQLDVGKGKNWRINNENNGYDYQAKGGGVIHPTIGYRLIKEGWSLFIKGGYKFHRIRYDRSVTWWSPGNISHVKHDMERITIQMGFGLH